jgi:hypothetical protein
MSELKDFAVEIWAIDAQAAKEFEAMIKQVNAEAILNKNARNLLKALRWIARRTDKTLLERLTKMQQLGELKTAAIVNLPLFTGWQ